MRRVAARWDLAGVLATVLFVCLLLLGVLLNRG